jgi:spore coat polysaccharide biosynthesis protein SpsF
MSELTKEENKKENSRHPRKLKHFDKVGCIIQARMGSSRLPGKVMLPLCNKIVIQQLVDRVRACDEIDTIIVAMPDTPLDKKLAEFCVKELQVGVFKGSENDVLGRVTTASSMMRRLDSIIVDITADCPLVDPRDISKLIKMQRASDLDYVSNVVVRSYPDGFDIQVYKKSVLEKVNQAVTNKIHRRHSGWNILNYCGTFFPQAIKIANMTVPEDKYFHPDWGLTLDTTEDWALLNYIFEHFKGELFSSSEVMDLILSNMDLLNYNKNVKRNTPGEG